MFELNGKIAIVTGASQGIGHKISHTLAKSGATVICVARSEKKIESLAEEISGNGGSAIAMPCDVSDQTEFIRTVDSVIKQFGKIDILVNNAGITRDSLLMRMKKNQWDEVLETNLSGTFYGMQSVIKTMMKNKFGRIINITSIVGLTGNAGQSNYAASKAGLIGLTQSIAKD